MQTSKSSKLAHNSKFCTVAISATAAPQCGHLSSFSFSIPCRLSTQARARYCLIVSRRAAIKNPFAGLCLVAICWNVRAEPAHFPDYVPAAVRNCKRAGSRVLIPFRKAFLSVFRPDSTHAVKLCICFAVSEQAFEGVFRMNGDTGGRAVVRKENIEDHFFYVRVPCRAPHGKGKRSVFLFRHSRIEAALSGHWCFR